MDDKQALAYVQEHHDSKMTVDEWIVLFGDAWGTKIKPDKCEKIIKHIKNEIAEEKAFYEYFMQLQQQLTETQRALEIACLCTQYDDNDNPIGTYLDEPFMESCLNQARKENK